MSRTHSFFRSQLPSLLIVAAVVAVVLGLFGARIYRFLVPLGIGGAIIVGCFIGILLLVIAFCFADMFRFLFNPRVVRRPELPDSIEIAEPDVPASEDEPRQPRKKEPRIVNPSRWHHSRWTGPGGFR